MYGNLLQYHMDEISLHALGDVISSHNYNIYIFNFNQSYIKKKFQKKNMYIYNQKKSYNSLFESNKKINQTKHNSNKFIY